MIKILTLTYLLLLFFFFTISGNSQVVWKSDGTIIGSDGEIKKESCNGVFMAIGHKPNTALLDNVIDTDEFGYIITKNGSTATNLDGVFACGDVQDKIYRQAVTAAGSGCMSAIDVEHYLESLKK